MVSIGRFRQVRHIAFALGAAGFLGACGMPPAPGKYESSAPVGVSGIRVTEVSLVDRLRQLLASDSRLKLMYYKPYVEELTPERFIEIFKPTYGMDGLQEAVRRMEVMVRAIHTVEQEFNNRYGISKIYSFIELQMSEGNFFNGANLPDRIRINLLLDGKVRSYEEYNSLMVAHETGHALFLRNRQGKLLIEYDPNNSSAYYEKIYNLTVQEMKTKGFIERFGLTNLILRPFFPNGKDISLEEFNIFNEILAHKVTILLLGYDIAQKDFIDAMKSTVEQEWGTIDTLKKSSDVSLMGIKFFFDYYELWKQPESVLGAKLKTYLEGFRALLAARKIPVADINYAQDVLYYFLNSVSLTKN